MIRIANVTELDTNNGPGFRTSIWVQGCPIHCDGCHNKELWDFDGGEPLSKYEDSIIASVLNKNCSGLSILGGEPLQGDSDKDLLQLCKTMKNLCSKSIWLFTGYSWSDVKNNPIMKYIDVLVDGPFIQKLRDTSLAFRGSSNQRLIDVQKTLQENKIFLYEN